MKIVVQIIGFRFTGSQLELQVKDSGSKCMSSTALNQRLNVSEGSDSDQRRGGFLFPSGRSFSRSPDLYPDLGEGGGAARGGGRNAIEILEKFFE